MELYEILGWGLIIGFGLLVLRAIFAPIELPEGDESGWGALE